MVPLLAHCNKFQKVDFAYSFSFEIWFNFCKKPIFWPGYILWSGKISLPFNLTKYEEGINQNLFFLSWIQTEKSVCVSSSRRENLFFSSVKGYTNKKVPFAIICSMHHKIKSPTVVHNELNWISIPAEEQSNFCVFPPSTQCGKEKRMLLSPEKSFVKAIHRVIL